MILKILILLAFIYLLAVLHFIFWYPELRWDWKKINLSNIILPKSFYWGTATASHQVEGDCTNNNWYAWENNFTSDGSSKIKNNQIAGNACEHWKRYKDDVKLIKNLGLTHYRLSLEWSKIEPMNGQYNEKAINHYIEVIDYLIKEDLVPVITLHHFTNPIWFEDLGGFEKERNIKYFISFCKMIFPLLF